MKKLNFLGLLLALNMHQTLGMERLQDTPASVVTKPYHPGFLTKYSPLSHVFKSGTWGAFYFLNDLMCNPLKALQYHAKFGTQWGKIVQEQFADNLNTLRVDEIASKLYKIANDFHVQCPTFSLGECSPEDFGACALSRTYRPEYREAFEQKAVTALLDKLSHSNAIPIEYVSFGCGGGFQDLVILTKTLAAKPNALINIHLIDIKHEWYTGCRDVIDNSHEVYQDRTVDLLTNINGAIQKIRTVGGLRNLDDNESKKQLIVDFIFNEIRFIQFITYLKRTFPLSQIHLYVHSTAKSYLEYLATHSISYPDVITGADIQDEISAAQRSLEDYIQLCIETRLKKPESKNVLLATAGANAKLASISLHPESTVGQVLSEEFENKETKKKTLLYCNVIDILPKKSLLRSLSPYNLLNRFKV